jgi:hypothetical protein
MSWSLSRFRAGDVVEVRSREEILATLDERGCLDKMPFMPEMLQFCGQRFRVGAVAHKTCETARQTWTGRRLHAAVHLAGVRCDGAAHGGCQADCNLFWKDAWLKPVNAEDGSKAHGGSAKPLQCSCTEARLVANTILPSSGEGDGPRYSCQTTKLYEATEPLPWWNLRQYWLDVMTRNHSLKRVVRVLWLSSLRKLVRRAPIGYRAVNAFCDWMHRLLTGRDAPSLSGKIKRGSATPVSRLDLQPGEFVQIRSQTQIEETLDGCGKNRGLSFDAEEMAPYCSKVFKVRNRVTRIIDEGTGKMLHMKQPCITLEGVVCNAEYAGCRLNCPRAIASYWREAWLERVSESVQDAPMAASASANEAEPDRACTNSSVAAAPSLLEPAQAS